MLRPARRRTRAAAAIVGAALLLALSGSASSATFGAARFYQTPPLGGPQASSAADLNGDGKPDFLMPMGFGRSAAVMLNKGDGTFKDAVTYPAADPPPMGGSSESKAAGAGDFNGDGKLDVAVGWTATAPAPPPPPPPMSAHVAVLNGNGDGTFALPIQKTANASGNLMGLAVGDVNGDGRPDIVSVGTIPNSMPVASSGFVSILYPKASGGFDSDSKSVANFLQGVVLGDFDHDGKQDIACVGSIVGAPFVWVYVHDAGGALVLKGPFGIGGPSSSIAAGDVNG